MNRTSLAPKRKRLSTFSIAAGQKSSQLDRSVPVQYQVYTSAACLHPWTSRTAVTLIFVPNLGNPEMYPGRPLTPRIAAPFNSSRPKIFAKWQGGVTRMNRLRADEGRACTGHMISPRREKHHFLLVRPPRPIKSLINQRIDTIAYRFFLSVHPTNGITHQHNIYPIDTFLSCPIEAVPKHVVW